MFPVSFKFFLFSPFLSFFRSNRTKSREREREIESKFAHRFPRKNRRNNMETLVARDEFACLLFAAISLPFFRRKLARYSPSVSIYLGNESDCFSYCTFSLSTFLRARWTFSPPSFFFTLSRTFQNPRFT